MNKKLALWTCFSLALALSAPALAQQAGMGGIGGTTGGTGGFGTGSFGTGATNSGGSSSGASTGGVGSTVISRPGFLSPQESNSNGGDSTANLKKGFLTPSNVNAISSGTTSRIGGTTGLATGSRLGALGGMGGLGGLGGMGSTLGASNSSNSTTPLRIPMRVGQNAETALAARTATAVRFNQRITNLPGLRVLAVSMQVADRTAILQGKVASAEQSDLIGRLALLEPGISAVQNNLTVDPTVALPEQLPTTGPSRERVSR